LTIVPPGGHPDGFFSGLLTNMNMAGSLCAIALPAFFRKKWVWFIPIILFGLFLSQTLGGVVPACVVIAWFLCRKFNKHKLRISLFFVLMALFYLLVFENIPQILEGNSRFEVWAKSFKVIKVRPIIGWGVGQFRYVFPRIYSFIIKGDQASLKWTYLHNEYLQYLVEVGSIGLFFALGFIGSLIRKGFKYKSELTFLALLGLTAALINAGGNFLFHTSVGVIVFVYAAILERGEKLCGKNGLFYS